ncbi:hypothetical protein FG386_000221 [Cryptosporidium ryanae]|uniref:uncharacterized protein n=1 Tax=Cryptosporidium ryanae TaxID=515981 RepID=UPI00351A812F|nr:hypothetical protein FG386_000221 [Cryptosporidium ryanae]
MSATLGSILFPGRQKTVVDNRKGAHNKRRKQVSSLKNQEQTAKQFTTRLLLDDETITPNDFLTPFPTDDIRNTEQFWEYMERVFYPIDKRWVDIFDLTPRPRNIVPDEKCIGLHFSYRWALVDLFDVDELFKLIGNKDKIFKSQNSNAQSQVTTRRRVSSVSDKGVDNDKQDKNKKDKDVSNLTNRPDNEDDRTLLLESKVIDYLKYLDLPLLELIGVNQTGDIAESIKKGPYNPYFEEWKYLYQRLCFIEKEIDSMIKRLTRTISDNIKKDNSRKLLQRHQKKRCKEFLVRSLHFHSMRQFMDSLEEVLYFDSDSNSYLTTWDDGEAVRAAWITQDQLLQLLLFRQNTTESKYSVSIPNEYIPYAKSLKTPLLNYLISSGLQFVSVNSEESKNIGKYYSGMLFDEDENSKIVIPEKGCIKLTRHPLCHYCRRSCPKLSYSRCPSKLKPFNIGFLTASGNSNNNNSCCSVVNSNSFAHNKPQTHNNTQQTPLISGNNYSTSSSSSTLNVYFSRSLVPWKVSRVVQDNRESINHSSPWNSSPQTFSNQSLHHTLTLNCSQVCNICSDFERINSEISFEEEVIISRAYSPNNCWRMYCSECIMHNFSSVIKQKHSNGVVLRYYCPFCSGSCNCERCLRNQQIRKIKNYLKSRFSGFVFQCSISSLLVKREITWCDFILKFGCNLIAENVTDPKCDNKDTADSGDTKYGSHNISPINEHGEINESLITIKNIANVSYINNYSIRMSVSENTHLGFIWLQANNIPFQKPPTNSPTGGDQKPKADPGGLASHSFVSTSGGSEMSKNVTKNKLRRSSLTGVKKIKRTSIGQANAAASHGYNIGEFSGSKIKVNVQSLSSHGIPHVNQTSTSGYTYRSASSGAFNAAHTNNRHGTQNIPPSVHIPREVLAEPTHASGTSVLWSLRSILNNNVNRYHKECSSNLEKWKEVQELYKKKRSDLEEYFEELNSKLRAMDDWIRSISFTETNKRYIMRKLPLLCWAAGIPSVKPFNFDDYPQLIPSDNLINLIHIFKTFVENGILSEDLPKHPVFGEDSTVEMSDGHFNQDGSSSVPQKTILSESTGGNSPKRLFSASLNTPTSVMEYVFKTVPEVQNVVVNLVSNTSKDECGKTQKSQRNTKKDKSLVNMGGSSCIKMMNPTLGADQTQLKSQLQLPQQLQLPIVQGPNTMANLDGSLGSSNPNNFASENFNGGNEFDLSSEGPNRIGSGLSSHLIESNLKVSLLGDNNYSSVNAIIANKESSKIHISGQTPNGGTSGGVGVVGGALGFGGVISEQLVAKSPSMGDSSSTFLVRSKNTGVDCISPVGKQISISSNSFQISDKGESIHKVSSLNGSAGVIGIREQKPAFPEICISQDYEHVSADSPVNTREFQKGDERKSPCPANSGFETTSKDGSIQEGSAELGMDSGLKMGSSAKAQFKGLETEQNVGVDAFILEKNTDLILKRKREKEGARKTLKRSNAGLEGLKSFAVESEIYENETEDSSNL